MKILILLSGLTLLSGCAFFAPPSEREARQLEAKSAGVEREQAINARAATHEKAGMSTQNARALAETEYRAGGGQ